MLLRGSIRPGREGRMAHFRHACAAQCPRVRGRQPGCQALEVAARAGGELPVIVWTGGAPGLARFPQAGRGWPDPPGHFLTNPPCARRQCRPGKPGTWVTGSTTRADQVGEVLVGQVGEDRLDGLGGVGFDDLSVSPAYELGQDQAARSPARSGSARAGRGRNLPANSSLDYTTSAPTKDGSCPSAPPRQG